MDPAAAYTACVVGALGLYLLVRPGGRGLKVLGTLLGLGAVGALIGAAAQALGDAAGRPGVFYVTFSLIAVACAVRMVTHSRPVFSALYFVMVVLSSAGLFLLMEAEFMAFALIIVYAGAILITYMFVLMLAQQAQSPDDIHGQPEYDRVPREPAAAATVGFVMLALLGTMIFDGVPSAERRLTEEGAAVEAWLELAAMPGRLDEVLRDEGIEPAQVEPNVLGERLTIEEGEAFVLVRTESGPVERVVLPASSMPENIQRVGWALVHRFPVSLELAGVILLMAMFGAVVLARKQAELGEDEVRQAAGMRPLAGAVHERGGES